MPHVITLWGVVTPTGEPIVGTLDYTRYGATYRYGASCGITPDRREHYWRAQHAQGYRTQKFTLQKENNHG